MSTRRICSSVALAVILVGASACSNDAKAKVKAAVEEAPTTTTTIPPTTTTAAPGPPAPLTGLATVGDEVAAINRPALAVKIDNSPPAVPQDGLNQTDVVVEVMVEGISRLMAVYHSHDAGSVGPTRSARHSDPDILALFGRPLFGWSGANEDVVGDVLSKDWIVNVEWNRVQSAYARRSNRKAPHNLYTSTPPLFERAAAGQPAPPAIFDRLGPGEVPLGSPLAGVTFRIGGTYADWVWDAASGRYLRWEYGRPHGTDDGQVWTTNIVILQTRYARGPKAQSTGDGRAWVLAGGNIVEGRWARAARTDRYTLTALDGTPIRLLPGRTWIELPPEPPAPLDAQSTSALLAMPR
jgi:hypothetical protein